MIKSLRAKSEKNKGKEPSPYPLKHIAIIMDGNRRWAKERMLPQSAGHKAGVKSLKELVKHAVSRQLEFMTVYAFSSENWSRSSDEVDYLMRLFVQVIKDELEELSKNGVRLVFIGDLDGLPSGLAKDLRGAMERTKENKALCLQVAVNYGARLELTQAIREIAKQVQAGSLSIDKISPELISSFLYTKDIPDPDLLVRTGGEMRLSNYLLWQSAYSELYITDVYWPDFNGDELDKAVAEFSSRQRRWGS